MTTPYRDVSPVRDLAEQAFSRAAGAPLVAGNRIRIPSHRKHIVIYWHYLTRDPLCRIGSKEHGEGSDVLGID
jgi:hypothetical protein